MEKILNLLSVQQFAEQMTESVAIGKNKIYQLVREPGFPSVKIGNRYYVLADKVNEWLEMKAGNPASSQSHHEINRTEVHKDD